MREGVGSGDGKDGEECLTFSITMPYQYSTASSALDASASACLRR